MDELPSEPTAPTVLIYRKEILRASETFIREQVISYRRWNPVLVAERRWESGLDVSDLQSITFSGQAVSRTSRVVGRARRSLGVLSLSGVRSMRKHNPKILHAHFGHDGVLALPYARALGIPLVVTLHGHDVTIHKDEWRRGTEGSLHTKYPEKFEKLATQPDVHFIAVSDAITESAVKFGAPAARTRSIPIGINTAAFPVGETPMERRRPRILYVGRLVPMKGADLLLQSFESVLRAVPEAELVIVGDGPMRTMLQDRATAHGDRVQFRGTLTPDLVRAEMHSARVFCLPSVTAPNGSTEGFGMVLLEAQSTGLPVVTSARGGAQQGMIDGATGFSFNEKDVPAMTRALTRVLADETLTVEMSRRAAFFVRDELDIADCTAKLEDFYDEVLAAHRSG